jgi:hypothetical protein
VARVLCVLIGAAMFALGGVGLIRQELERYRSGLGYFRDGIPVSEPLFLMGAFLLVLSWALRTRKP